MPSEDSSPAECPPGIHSLFDPCPGDCAEPVEEPPGSASSSPDERCKCDHSRRHHSASRCTLCTLFDTEDPRAKHAFAPADAETAVEPEAPTAAQEAAMDELTHLRQEMEATEPEAPECGPCGQCPHPADEHSIYGCADDCACEWMPPKAQPPRRPPYAVAYATEGGAQYEIALPGDATIRAEAGALIVTHASAVTALTQARPMES